jgi:hypothetical protein
MLDDLVVDTNVLMHADNPNEDRQADAAEMLEVLLASDTALVVDEGFHLDEGKNKSLIGAEYLRLLQPLSTGYRVLAALASNGRVTFTDLSLDAAVRKRINQLVRNKRDRTFLRGACKSAEHVLCSHDYQDLAQSKRRSIKKELDIQVDDAEAVTRALRG